MASFLEVLKNLTTAAAPAASQAVMSSAPVSEAASSIAQTAKYVEQKVTSGALEKKVDDAIAAAETYAWVSMAAMVVSAVSAAIVAYCQAQTYSRTYGKGVEKGLDFSHVGKPVAANPRRRRSRRKAR